MGACVKLVAKSQPRTFGIYQKGAPRLPQYRARNSPRKPEKVEEEDFQIVEFGSSIDPLRRRS